jgi:V-type H+-transporting ATPase subunit d
MTEALFFNAHSGYLEAIIRGYKVPSRSIRCSSLSSLTRSLQAGLLSQNQYQNLTQCETIDGEFFPLVDCQTDQGLIMRHVRGDLKLQLSATDYGNFLAHEPSPISTSTIAEKATQRLVDEFSYIKANSTGQLSKFLDYITSV